MEKIKKWIKDHDVEIKVFGLALLGVGASVALGYCLGKADNDLDGQHIKDAAEAGYKTGSEMMNKFYESMLGGKLISINSIHPVVTLEAFDGTLDAPENKWLLDKLTDGGLDNFRFTDVIVEVQDEKA